MGQSAEIEQRDAVPGGDQPANPGERRARHVGPAAVFVGALVVLAGDRIGLDAWFPVAQLTAFRLQLAVAVLVAGLLTTLWRRWWYASALLAPGLLAVAALAPGLIGDPLGGDVQVASGDGGRPLTVLTANVLGGKARQDQVRQLVRRTNPDVVVLTEAGNQWTARLEPLLLDLGYVGKVTQTQDSPFSGTALFARRELAPSEIGSLTGSNYGALQLRGGALGSLRVVAAHPISAIPGRTRRWRADLERVNQWCDGSTIVAGDLNAALDHSRLRTALDRCRDAAKEAGTERTGTWPSSLPRWAGIQIDHILVPPSVDVVSVGVHDLPGSDHRAVLARLRLR